MPVCKNNNNEAQNCYNITTTVNCHESVLELCTFNSRREQKYVEHKKDPLDFK